MTNSIPPRRERKPLIVLAVERLGVATVAEVAEGLDISKATVRQDMTALEREGKIVVVSECPRTWEASERNGVYLTRSEAQLVEHVFRCGLRGGTLASPASRDLASRLARILKE